MKRTIRFIVYGLFFLFFWPFFLLQIKGQKPEKNINRKIIISNHYSDFDSFFLYLLYGFKNNIHFVAFDGVKKNPFTRLFCWAFNCIYVSHDVINDTKAIRECVKVLKNDENLVIFPEGAMNPSKYGFFEFSRSFCFMSRMAKADVIYHYISPNVGLFKRTKVYVGETLSFQYIEECKDDEIAATKILAKVMDLAAKEKAEEKSANN